MHLAVCHDGARSDGESNFKVGALLLGHLVLKRLKIRYKKLKSSRTQVEESENLRWLRQKYLKDIQEYRAKGYQIIWCDETWVWAADALTYGWVDVWLEKNPELVRHPLSGLHKGLPKQAKGAGRLLMCHAIDWEHGLMPGAELVIKTSGHCNEYKNEMDASAFEQWFANLCRNIHRESLNSDANDASLSRTKARELCLVSFERARSVRKSEQR